MSPDIKIVLTCAMGIRRFVCWYDRDTSVLLGEVEADTIPLTDLQQLFDFSVEEQREGWKSYLIDQQQALVISRWVDISFSLDQYIYQLDCYQYRATEFLG